MIEIDGGHGEGGGQILRTAVGMACALGRGVIVHNIRKGRSSPGLRPQHLKGVELAAEMCDADVSGLGVGSTRIEFVPRSNLGGSFETNIGTAGSISLVLQTCLIPAVLARGPTTLAITGGTDVPWSPPMDYFGLVTATLLRKMGADIDVEVEQRGYYPQGGGRAVVRIGPAGSLMEIALSDRGAMHGILGRVSSRNLPDHIRERTKTAAARALQGIGAAAFDDDFGSGPSTGVSIVLAAEFERSVLGASCLGQKGLPAERVGELAALALREEVLSGATLDEHASDQIIPFLFLAPGRSTVLTAQLSAHAKTNIWVAQQFIEREVTIEEKGTLVRVTVE